MKYEPGRIKYGNASKVEMCTRVPHHENQSPPESNKTNIKFAIHIRSTKNTEMYQWTSKILFNQLIPGPFSIPVDLHLNDLFPLLSFHVDDFVTQCEPN